MSDSPERARAVSPEQLPEEAPAPGVRFRRVEAGQGQLRRIRFSEEFYEESWCRRAHFGCVLSGAFSIEEPGGRVVRFAQGDFVVIEADAPHRHHGTEGAAELVVYEPAP